MTSSLDRTGGRRVDFRCYMNLENQVSFYIIGASKSRDFPYRLLSRRPELDIDHVFSLIVCTRGEPEDGG